MRQTEAKFSFNNGEVSPRYQRADHDKYPSSVKTLENFLIQELGGVSFAPGSRYVANTKDVSQRARLIPFQFNSAQAYLLELGDQYMRFFTNRGQVIVNASNPIDSYTKLLIHFDGTNGQTTYTPEVGPALSFFNQAQLDTSVKKFGVSSLKLDGSSDGVGVLDSADWDFGTADFTIDFWVRFNSVGTAIFISRGQAVGAGDYELYYNHGDTTLRYSNSNSVIKSETWAPTTGTWYHIALVKTSGNFKMFVNGTALGSNTANATDIQGSNDVYFGTDLAGGSGLNGWMDEIRISKGIARWTSTFTPPTSQYGGAADWLTTTAYVVGDYVTESGTVYICLIAHTSGTFATDLAAGKWTAQIELEIATPYALADVPAIQYAQNKDVMYLYHRSYPVQKLTRLSATDFSLTQVDFVRGPFLDTNITSTTIDPSSDTGSTTLTASSGIFESGHVGSYWRVKNGVVKITSFTNTTTAVGTVQAEPSGTAGDLGTGGTPTVDWAEGAFSDVRGYPRTGAFHEQRHYVAGTTYEPQKGWGTNIGAYENMKEDANDDSAAVIFEISDTQANEIKWIDSDANVLQTGSGGGTNQVSSGSEGITITADNIKGNKDSSYGAAAIPPKRISSYLYYVGKTLFKLFELVYNYVVNRHVSNNMTKFADHILRDGDGAYEIAYQQSPNDRIWVIRNDGQLAIMTRNPDENIVGWSRRIAGLDSTTNGVYESIAVIQQDDQDDEVWVIVKRKIGGVTKRFVEYFTEEFFEYEWEPVLLDCSLTLDNPINITGATKANPVVITAPSHGFSNGDTVKIDKVEGMTDLNGNSYKIKNKTTNTFELTNSSDVNINGTAFGTYIQGGEVRKKVTAISGLDHLEGETVSAQVDGELPSTETYTVTSGAITLSTAGAVVHVGLPYTGKIVLLKMTGQTAQGATGQTKTRRTYLSTMRVDKTKSFKIGQTEATVKAVAMPESGLYTGDVEKHYGGTWSKKEEIVILQDSPLPVNILAIFFRQEINEV